MSDLLLDGENPTPGIIKGPPDSYWDAPITRREVQSAINEICLNEQALENRSDTTNIVLNFLLEKFNVTRGELDVYVERKKSEAAALLKEANEQSKG